MRNDRLEHAETINLTEQAEKLLKGAEKLRTDDGTHEGPRLGHTDELDEAVAESLQGLRRLAAK